ncbi:hypothetical protein P872_06970 [Rhodonellum psychrophilum GCM71 = DSM 17998]|uniref:PpiC domain-containing protein n=2 Tax=Rhodonellum TaxID=336827 RepID=U5C153_9BACT|nr:MULTISPECIES: peptidylprolyl isomerase [Rhodonellum]ERM81872.1 hypothetical protein P872_06970 [Rhodonellum psychrophilum GCM71 = DSM 17998]
MSVKHLCIVILVFVFSCSPKALIPQETLQDNTPKPLLIIGNEEVFSEEFLHILSKSREFQTMDEKLTSEEFEKNLALFINFKLKVKEAENLGLDKVEEFDREFEMFKEDLIKPFLIKNSLQEGELMKAYNRMQEVVKASHILLQFPNNASREDSIAVFRMAEKLKKEAEAGADFNELAAKYSDDPSAKENKGSLGYFTALQMVYQFEDAAFSLNPGEISSPVLTNFGYHIIKLEDRKPNPGEIKVSHILVRTQAGDPVSEERALRKIGDIYTELQKPESIWEEVCQAYSEDLGTKNTGGNLPWIGVGAVLPDFERVAFALTEEGEISPPVKTLYGFHIIRLEDKKPIAPYEEMEAAIKSKILRDSRSGLIQSQVLAMQKSKFGYVENEALIEEVKKVYTENQKNNIQEIVSQKQLLDSTLFTITAKPKTVGDFIGFTKADRQNVRITGEGYFKSWFDKFIEVSLNEAEEADLLANNDDYRLLIKEYRDGILLFSLMNEKVWQKALEDSLGQQNFFAENIDRYQWKERVNALIVKMGKDESAPAVKKFLSDKKLLPNLQDRLENTFLDKDPLAFTMEEGIYELEAHPVLKKADPTKTFQDLKIDGKVVFLVLGEKVPAGPKKFEETRGKVIQDFQEYLEKDMVRILKKNYIIRINEDEKQRVFETVVNR